MVPDDVRSRESVEASDSCRLLRYELLRGEASEWRKPFWTNLERVLHVGEVEPALGESLRERVTEAFLEGMRHEVRVVDDDLSRVLTDTRSSPMALALSRT